MTRNKEQRTANSTLAIGGVPSPIDSFVVAESSVLRINPLANGCLKVPPIANLQNVISNPKTTAHFKTKQH